MIGKVWDVECLVKTMSKRKKIAAFYPYSARENAYIENMISVWGKEYKTVPYSKYGILGENARQCEVIILNWFESEIDYRSFLQLLLYRISGKKIVWVFHNLIPHEAKQHWIAMVQMKCMILISNRIILHSKFSKEYLYHYSPIALRKATYVPHINYCENYLQTDKTFREKFGFHEDDMVFMFFGLIKPYKNIELLIEIFKEWDKEKTKLLIVGKATDGKYAKMLHGMCEYNSNIILDFHYVNNSEVYTYFNTADVVVMPYHKASSMNSGAMIAAFSCGKTVIIPDIAMARDMENVCYVYHYEAEEEHKKNLEKTLVKCYEQGREANLLLGQRAKKYVMKRNSREVVEKKIRQLC